MLRVVIAAFLATVCAQEPVKTKEAYGRPALIETSKLTEFETLALARDSPWLPYRFSGSDPKDGGFDCSGAMYFVMRKAGLDPPRRSAAQFLWLKEKERLIEVPEDATDLDHPVMKKLQPGDLLFWGGTCAPGDDRKVNITQVALFLGLEKSDGRAVTINPTDGRPYRGTKANGYGVYDFQLPREGGRSVFMGYGTPPGVGK